MTDEQIDEIANDGHRNAAGGIYANHVHEFARALLASKDSEIDKQEAVEHIASVYEDSDGTKYVQFDVEDAEDIPVGTKLYPVARTLTRREIEEIAGYVEDECKACSGMTTLYIAAEAAVEETLRRIASPIPAQSCGDAEQADKFDKWAAASEEERAPGSAKRLDAIRWRAKSASRHLAAEQADEAVTDSEPVDIDLIMARIPTVARLYYTGIGSRRYRRASTQTGPGEPLVHRSHVERELQILQAELHHAARAKDSK